MTKWQQKRDVCKTQMPASGNKVDKKASICSDVLHSYIVPPYTKGTLCDAKAKKKIMSVSSDMSKNVRVGRSGKYFFIF